MEGNESPEIQAMRLAMKQATEAAEQRRLAKEAQMQADEGGPFEDEPADEDWEVLEATTVYEAEPFVPSCLREEQDEDLGGLLAELDAAYPELDDVELHGELMVRRQEAPADPWYTLAAEAAIPAAIREMPGDMDIKRLIQALMVEVGDVKRTNAMLLEHLVRLEEKVDRVNRHLHPRR